MSNIILETLKNTGIALTIVVIAFIGISIIAKFLFTVITLHSYKTKKEFWEDIFLPYYLYKEYKKLK